MRPRVKVYFDGGCRPAPAGMETAVVVRGKTYVRRQLGAGTSMEAEWLALIDAVRIAQELGLDDPLFIGDSLAVVSQANGWTRCRGISVELFQTLQALDPSSVPLRIRHVRRAQNLAGIALARLHVR